MELYRERRLRLAQQMQRGVAVIATAPEHVAQPRRPLSLSFRQLLLLFDRVHGTRGGARPDRRRHAPGLLFCRDKDLEREDLGRLPLWAEGAKQAFGFDDGSLDQAAGRDAAQAAGRPAGHLLRRRRERARDARLIQWLNAVRAQVRTGISRTGEIRDVRKLLDDMRLDQGQPGAGCDASRREDLPPAPIAARCAAHAPGVHEYEVEAGVAARVPAQRRAGTCLHTHRRRWRQRLRAALRRQRSAAQGRRPAADRRRLRDWTAMPPTSRVRSR